MKNLIFILFLFFSCTTTTKVTERQVMDSWMNGTKVALIQNWGPPTRVTDDGQGGEILVYDRANYIPNYYTGSHITITRSRSFYVNKDGIIYSWFCDGRRGY